jgi:hypothetical protein
MINLRADFFLPYPTSPVKSLFEWRDKQKAGQVVLDMDALLEITSEF